MGVSVLDRVLWALAFVAALALAYLSLGPPPTGAGQVIPDKAGHAVAYTVTVLLFLFAAVWRPGRGSGPFPRSALTIATGAFAASVAIEFLQETYFSRDGDVADALANLVGSVVALTLWTLTKRLSPQRSVR